MLSKNDGKIFKYNDIKAETWFPELYRVLKDGSHCYVMTNLINLEKYLTISRQVGFGLHNLLIWNKNNAVTNRWYMKNCEYVLFLRKGKAFSIHNGGSKTVHQFDNILGHKNHPTEKPVELMKFYIENSSKIGDLVFDPFMGTGATGVGALEVERDFMGFEIDPDFFAIAQQRLTTKESGAH